MGEYKDLSEKEAIQKIKDIIMSAEICMFTTNLHEEPPLQTRPMATADVDDNGTVWFFSNNLSDKNKEIHNNKTVQLFYANKSSAEYLSIYGNASIVIDKEKAQSLWTPIVKAWFKNGVDDPELTLIKVKPIKAHYWDTKHNKMISLFKIFASTVTGAIADDAVEGSMVF
jgi:general stress protein 26